MAERHVLIVTYHFPPSAASGTFRMLGFARHLPRYDWRVSVVAPPELPWEPVDPALTDQVPFQTMVHSVPYPRQAPKLLRWAAPWGVWLRPAWKACRRLLETEPIDAVLTSGPPHCVHVLGYHLQQRFDVPWIADFRDPWIRGGGKTPRGVAGLWARRWERKVFRQADVILANAPNATAALRHDFPRWAGKIETLTNGFDPIDSQSVSAADAAGWCGVRLVHAGELYAGRDPRPLFDALAEWNQSPDAALRPMTLDIVGRTSQCGLDLEAEIAARGLASLVALRGQVSYQEAAAAMVGADVLVLLDGPGRTIGVPAKLYEYLAAGRPILALAEEASDTANILRESGVMHRVVPPEKTELLVPALTALATPGNDIGNAPGRERFSRLNLAGRLAEILAHCLDRQISSRSAR